MNDFVTNQRNHQKSLLAKLLARENIRVEIRNCPTAAFDVESRILIIPKMLDDVSEAIYNSDICHEVGHALYTPSIDWAEFIKIIPHYICNIVEDARIEKLIKNIYPGSRKDFFRAYREMFDKGFFGVKSLEEANQLKFIDRFNIHFKMGKSFGIKFLEEEMPYVEKAYALYSWKDATKLMVEIYEYIKLQKEDQKKSKTSNSVNTINVEDGCGEPGNNEKTESLTHDSLEEAKKKLLDALGEEIINVYAVSNDWRKRIISYKEIFKYSSFKFRKLAILSDYQKYAKPYVEHMVQQFNLKKNALELKLESYNKTGNLDLDRIHEYKLDNDIFIKNIIQPKGKSHGLVLFMDWSGSMHPNLQSSLYQLFILTDFCKKLEIPFETYTFTSAGAKTFAVGSFSDKKYPGSLVEYPYRLVNILSSEMSNTEYQKMQQILLDTPKHNTGEYFAMGGTPLNETIMAAMEIVPIFQSDKKLDFVNICFISDGDGHNLCGYYDQKGVDQLDFSLSKNVYIHDPKTYYVEKYQENLTIILLNMLRNRVKSNVIGFYLASPISLSIRLRAYIKKLIEEKIVTIEKLEGYTHYHIIDNSLINITLNHIDKRLKFILSQFIQLIT